MSLIEKSISEPDFSYEFFAAFCWSVKLFSSHDSTISDELFLILDIVVSFLKKFITITTITIINTINAIASKTNGLLIKKVIIFIAACANNLAALTAVLIAALAALVVVLTAFWVARVAFFVTSTVFLATLTVPLAPL